MKLNAVNYMPEREGERMNENKRKKKKHDMETHILAR